MSANEPIHNQNQHHQHQQQPHESHSDHQNQQHRRPQQEPQQTPKQKPLAFTRRRTHPLTWLAAVICTLFWVIVIVGGLAVLIVYLVFRPRSPRFDISTATLNAAYLDTGYFLNADFTILANFSNPSKKVDVSFDSMSINLYYGSTLIATCAVESFSISRRESKLADVHLVSSLVHLPVEDSRRLEKERGDNAIAFAVKGRFRTSSRYGNSFLHFNYWLHSRCSILITAPPSGVLLSSNCTTKR